ncbi:MAG: DNA polymerase/3'-5' exonuclease PolX [Pirellulaceae bacterium]|nr:DNA polymerase/3'-5' exonuclease PolX [Pirellulaceae bacterium]
MNNAEIAHVFEELADLLELRGENAFRVRAYRNGAKVISELTRPVCEIVSDPTTDLQSIAGIGDTLAEKCRTLVTTGKLPQLEQLRADTPEVLVQMTRIPGLGAKKALVLLRELNLQSLDDLRQACQEHRVQSLKGFAARSEQQILAGLAIAAEVAVRLRIDQVERIVQRLREHLQSCAEIQQLEFAGSYRRGRETVGDLDILVVSCQPDAVMDRLESFPGRVSTIARGATKLSIRIDAQFQVDLRVVPAESFGAALQYFTGSKEHNVAVRSRARKLGLSVNEYGVSSLDNSQNVSSGRTEEELYARLGLCWIPPELREGRQELSWAEQPGRFPELIEPVDIIADLHMHTWATDGSASIEHMAEAARSRGLRYIAITDHSQRVSMARGLNEQRLLEQWAEIDALNVTWRDQFRILKGVECDILEAGPLDIIDEVLAQADWVVASVHYGQKQSRQQITDRIVGALQNPHVDAIAHPTGRLLGSRPPYAVDMQAVFQAAAEHTKSLELNASPYRLDLSEPLLIQAAARGIPITINTDAHSIDGLSAMRYGVTQARRAGLLRRQVLNTWSLEQLLRWLIRD